MQCALLNSLYKWLYGNVYQHGVVPKLWSDTFDSFQLYNSPYDSFSFFSQTLVIYNHEGTRITTPSFQLVWRGHCSNNTDLKVFCVSIAANIVYHVAIRWQCIKKLYNVHFSIISYVMKSYIKRLVFFEPGCLFSLLLVPPLNDKMYICAITWKTAMLTVFRYGVLFRVRLSLWLCKILLCLGYTRLLLSFCINERRQ